jgi:hypothetical protein
MSEYFLNNYRVFKAGNYLDETCAIATFISLLEGPLLAESGRSENLNLFACFTQQET